MLKKLLLLSAALTVLALPTLTLYTDTNAASSQDILKTSWENYKNTYIDNDGAVRRRDQGNDVVSEGVGYTLIRATLMNDQQTFDKVYNWTEKNLSRLNNPQLNDNLLAWQFSSAVSDWGAASDADEDYAVALAFASKKWGTPTNGLPSYEQKSIAIQKDILKLETGWVGDKVYLQPGTWYAFSAPIPVNPSYLSPAFYKIFNQMSPDPRWEKLINSSYEVLWKASATIDSTVGVGLPADWVVVNSNNAVSKKDNNSSDYRFDAFRTNFRIALDYVWFNDIRAKNYLTLSGGRNFLQNELNTKGSITAEYAHNGQPLSQYENAGVDGVNIGWFIPENGDIVNKLLNKIENQYNQNTGKFFSTPNYYMENWAWFGYALGSNNLPNIYTGQTLNQTAQTEQKDNKLEQVLKFDVSLKTPAPQQTAVPPTAPASNGQYSLEIQSPQAGEGVNGTQTMRVKNTYPSNQGTWWSVDSGSWVALNQPSAQSNQWVGDIDFSSWNWNSEGKYTLHAWTKVSAGNQIHTQIDIQK